MKKIFTIISCGISAFALHAQNNCATAVPVTVGIYNATYSDGSQVPAPICTNGVNNNVTKGIWYSYTSATTVNVTVSTDVQGFTPQDTRVHVYNGMCGNLTCVAGDDDSGSSYSSIVSFTAQAGETYYIAFDNNWNDFNFTFQVFETAFTPALFETVQYNATGSYVMCVVDMNGDYFDDIVIPDNNQIKMFYQQTDGTFTETARVAGSTPYMPGWSLAAGDYDGNGFNDLLYGNGNGAALMIANADGTQYTAMQSPQSIFSQRTNFVDLNNDGHLDAFVCHDVAPNCYFLNDGNGGFSWVQGGIGDHPSGGNYGSIWVDYDNDGDADLFIAKCRGGGDPASINELHRNNGDGTFTNVSQEANLADMLQTWSTAWGDFDNDGDMDALVGANSTANGPHKLMRNNGDGTFTDVTEGSGFADLFELNREHIAHDFNNDGWIDVMGGGNYIMFNNGDMTFTKTQANASVGPIGDLNNDGFLDILNFNQMKLNNGNDNNWIKLHLEGTESNRNGIGARVEVYAEGDGWEKQIRDVRSGDGFRYMSSLNTHFGLGTTDAIEQIIIKWPSGIIDVIENPDVNQAITVQEGSTLGTGKFTTKLFSTYPNPVKDVLNFTSDDTTQITEAHVYDISGKLIITNKVENNALKVQQLANGNYLLVLKDSNGKYHSAKFIKK
ncbi:FG-GAP-like repeat-containing protein [Flavobacterium sp.]|uniref:FG-GAP-like repeat-containing protein n=1 Tax=Flavobacterium sp. TaxID=239 RepID=UPI002637485F|nr:FG-GAP-like repeat-containing protein [Flavobacterium sp.]